MDMKDLQSLARPGRSGGSAGGFGHHAFGPIAGYNVSPDSTSKKPDHANDTIFIDLQRPCLGYADASPENPVRVEISIAPPKPSTNKKARTPLAIIDIRDGRGTADPTLIGDFVMLKDVENKGGKLVARRAEVAVREFKADRHYVRSGLLAIRPEREQKGHDGEPYFSQQRIGLLTEFADPITTVEQLKTCALQALADAAAVHASRPFFVLRGIQENAEGKHHFSIAREIGLYDAAARQEFTPEEAVDRFISGDDGNNGPQILQYLGSACLFEVIPQFRVSTGGASLPSSRRQADEEKGTFSEANAWRYDDGHGQRFSEDERTETGYSMMDMVIQRLPDRKNEGSLGRPHTIFSQPQRPVQSLFKLSEVVTKNLSPKLTADLIQRADARATAVRQANKAPKPEAAAPGQDETQSDDFASTPPGM